MVKSILFVLLIILAVMGICELIYLFRMLFYFPGQRVNGYFVIVLKSGCAVNQLNFIWQKMKWHGDNFANAVIAIVDNLDMSEKLICSKFIIEKNIFLCNMSSVSQCIENKESF